MASSGFKVNSATSITATSPAGTARTVDVSITNATGTSATNTSAPFTYVPPMVVVTAVRSTSANAGAGLTTLAVTPKTAGDVLVAYAQVTVDLVSC